MRRNLERLRCGLPIVLGNRDEDVVCAGVLRVEVEAQGGVRSQGYGWRGMQGVAAQDVRAWIGFLEFTLDASDGFGGQGDLVQLEGSDRAAGVAGAAVGFRAALGRDGHIHTQLVRVLAQHQGVRRDVSAHGQRRRVVLGDAGCWHGCRCGCGRMIFFFVIIVIPRCGCSGCVARGTICGNVFIRRCAPDRHDICLV